MTRIACGISFCVHAVARLGIDRFPSYARIKEKSRSHS